MNLTPPPPSQNSHAVKWHCTAESERRVAEIIIIIIIIIIIMQRLMCHMSIMRMTNCRCRCRMVWDLGMLWYESCSSWDYSEQWKWRWWRQFEIKIWTDGSWSEKVSHLSNTKPRFRAEWVVLSEELWILASCLLRPMSRNSVLEELSIKRFAVCLSICPSQDGVLPTWLNTESRKQCCIIAQVINQSQLDLKGTLWYMYTNIATVGSSQMESAKNVKVAEGASTGIIHGKEGNWAQSILLELL